MDREKLIRAAHKERTAYLPTGPLVDNCIVDAILAEIKAQGYVIVEAKNASWGGQLPVGDS